MTVLTETFFAGTFLNSRFSTLRMQFADKLTKRKVYQTTLVELNSLTDRDLTDLDISRTDIKLIAFEAAYGQK